MSESTKYEVQEKLLRSQARTYVPDVIAPTGNEQIIIVGEQPGQVEVMMRKPFEGPCGKLLKSSLQLAEIPLSICRLTNVLKDFDRPLEGYLKAPKTRLQSPQWLCQRATDYVLLLQTLIAYSPAKIVIAVGNVALQAVAQRWGISKWRGSPIPLEEGKICLPIIHPSTVLRGESENRYLIIQDLKKARDLFDNPALVAPRTLLTKPSYKLIIKSLNSLYEQGLLGHTIAFDIEIKNLELNCISFCIDPKVSISIPLVDAKGDIWNPLEEAEIMRGIARILSSREIRKLGQNLIFDTHFLLRRYGIRTHNIDDTMVAHHTLLPQLPKGLDMITSLYTYQEYYKDEGKEWMKGRGTYDRLWAYNALDSAMCAESFPLLLSALIKQDNQQAYERQLSIVEPLCYMMERGIRVDIDALRESRQQMKAEADAARKQLERIAPGLNPNSPKQLQDYFYTRLKLPPYKNKQHKVSADSEAMKRIARRRGEKGSLEASLILKIKKQEKLISTYLLDLKFDADNRVRCSYNPSGTTYSRLSSSSSIFGTGMNMQNWPHEMLRFLKPDEGYVAYTVDLSQAENRIVAYVGKIDEMIEAFETGKDVHRLTASLIFGKAPEEISDEPGSSSLGNGESTERQWGKKANHGLNYDLGYKSFALLYELPENEAKWIVEKYHAAYPGVRRNFHAYVKRCLNESRTLTNLMGRKTIFITDRSDKTYKEAYSCIPQGTVGDIINERGLAFLYYNKLFKSVELLQQVHDSITFQIPLSEPWNYHAFVLQSLKDSLEQPLTTHYGRQFVIPADTVMGLSLMKEEGYELKSKKWPESIEHLAESLARGYEQLKEGRRAD